MELDGIDALIAKFDQMHDDIEKDVGEIVKNNTIEMTEKTVKNAVFTQGYQTGFTKRNIWAVQEDANGLRWKTFSRSGHSGFLEFGTRYMSAQPFVGPAYFKQKQKFLDDLERLVK